MPSGTNGPPVALITGAGSGLGRALALTLAAEGHPIAGVDLRPEGLANLERVLHAKGARVGTALADVTDAEATRKAAADLEQRLGPAGLLIASAGIGIETSALSFRAEDFGAVVRVNLLGVANSVAAVLPGMIERRAGHLVAISSLASYRGMPLMAGYCASKAGVNALMDSLRVELRTRGVFVTTVCPGWIRTPMTANLRFPVPKMMDVDDAARRIARAVRARQAFFAFPGQLAWQVRLLRWLPSGLSDWLIGRMMSRTLPE